MNYRKPGEASGKSRKFAVHRIAKILAEIKELYEGFNFCKPEDKNLFFAFVEAYRISGLTIDHLCGQPACINPNHLEWVHMDLNQRRKYWGKTKRRNRMSSIALKTTRHQQQIQQSTDVFNFLARISSRRYRKKL